MGIWDVLDERGNITGKTIDRGEILKEGEYHLVVHIWIINDKGEILIQKRPNNLKFAPGKWAITGGSAIQGEDSITAACRETKEELGIDIQPIYKPIRHKRNSDFTDIWVVKQEINLEDIKLQKEEVCDVKWVTVEELRDMIHKGTFHRYSEKYFGLLSKYLKIF